MKRASHIVIWTFIVFVGSTILISGGLIGFLMLTEFSPARSVTPQIGGNGKKFDPAQREFTFLTWNIGYAGLGAEMDFFFDGGKSVRPEQSLCSRYFDGIKNQLKASDTSDFIFLQEVDADAKRSWFTDEVLAMEELMTDFSMVFAMNYNCRFVPVPVLHPMGKVKSGLVFFSRFRPDLAEVRYFDVFFPWPKRMVFLKRCFIMLRFGLDNGKELILINTHNSAFDSSGTLRKRELFTLDSAMKSEYLKGNYVVAGGDWNNNPRGFGSSEVMTGDLVYEVDSPISSDILTDWQFVFDRSRPTNRNVDKPYSQGMTKTTIIDFFVVSPNIEVKSVVTVPAGFVNSDHEPVRMTIMLK